MVDSDMLDAAQLEDLAKKIAKAEQQGR
jgi:hypothetical protein